MELFNFSAVLTYIILIWSIPWKIVAMWKAGQNRSKIWFVALMLLNTAGILEILYIFIFGRKKSAKTVEPVHEPSKHDDSGMINFADFQKVHMRVAQIREAERVENSDKLLKLKVTIGGEERQVVAGIGKAYKPEDLVAKEIIVVTNLEPRKLMGLESQAMLLAASSGDHPVLLMPDKEVAPGSKIS